jgi:8-amino-7-oxononanoate synthase
VSWDDDVRAELAGLEAAHRRRVPRVLDGRQGAHAVLDGREVVNFSSNDYLGLAGDGRLVRAAATALEGGGTGVGASRLISGNHREHVALEAAVRDWLACGAVQLFNTGYAANVGVLTTLLRAGDVVFSDELNHASIIDGCRLSRAEVVVFAHRSVAALALALAAHPRRRKLVVSESLFSMDGDVAEVEAMAQLCARHEAAFVLDEAHAIGVVGPEGRGVAAWVGAVPDVVIGTFGKALGSFGAFAATSQPIADLLWNRARTLVFSTGLPASVAVASRVAIDIVRGPDGADRRATLAGHAAALRARVTQLGGVRWSPIAPLLIGEDRAAMRAADDLLAQGLFVQGIRPPTVAVGAARLRVGLSAAHSPGQVEQLAGALSAVAGVT